ncbi:MAG: protocatechuate 3,4-dioxygenase subunit beta [Ramlibacter sp.]
MGVRLRHARNGDGPLLPPGQQARRLRRRPDPVARGAPRASGRPLHVTGRVLDLGARPVGGVIVEIWQANHVGRYDHPSDGNPAPIDPYFRGYGVTVTDAQGRYSFRTIQPAGYPVAPGWSRAPHVHFLLTGRHDRHVTQMWFPDEPLNAQDRLLLLLAPTERERVIARMKEPTRDMPADARCAVFDIVLPNG